MLDFYSISDCMETPEYPDESDYIDGFKLEEYKQLDKLLLFCVSVGIEIRFHCDFRLYYDDIKKMKRFIENLEKESLSEKEVLSYHKLLDIFTKVNDCNKNGLICFCD